MAGQDITSLKNRANKAKIKGNLEEAIECYQKIIKLNPDDANIFREIGSLYEKMGRKDKAFDFYWKAMDQYVEQEFYQNATAIAQILLRSGANKLDIKVELAELYKKQGLIGDAVSTYEELAELYRRDGDFDGVFENFKKIINLTPKTVSIRLKLVEIYENKNMIDEAIAELHEVMSIYKEQGRVNDVDEIEARIAKISGKEKEVEVGEGKQVVFEQEVTGLGEEESAEEVLEEAVESRTIVHDFEEFLPEEIEGEEEVAGTIEHELKQLSEEGYIVLEAPGTKEIEESISGWDDWINLAELYLSVGSEEDAIEYYNKAAEAHFNKKNYKKAYELYKTISELNPDVLLQRQKMVQTALKLNSREKAVEAYVSLYECLNNKGAKEEANKVLEKAKRIAPDSPIILEITGEKVKASKVSEAQKAETIDFDELFEEEVASEEGAEFEFQTASDLDTLLEQFKRKAAEEITVSDYEAHFNLGITYKEMGLIEEAMDAFKKAMKGERWTLKSTEMIGKCLEILEDYEKAERIYKKVLESKKYNEDETISFAYSLGDIFARQKEYKKALKEYKKVLRIDPEFQGVKERIELMNKGLKGEEVDIVSITGLVEISEEGGELWDSVIKEDETKEKERGEDLKDKKERDKISYI
ncbi:tetratricopeptide repeat protein [candidate division WOR-3 bacterium]|nr:tetratricopeptide repeat protein [candidate division WOR-3 bacterium]